MKIYLNGQNNQYETEKLIRIFFPFHKMEFTENEKEADIILKFSSDDRYYAKVSLFGKTLERQESRAIKDEKASRRFLSALLYDLLSQITGYSSPWGILTGVRPAKYYASLKSKMGEQNADDYFINELRVSRNKLSLCKSTYDNEAEIIKRAGDDSFSLYIGIPFCPSRCSYCSFVSHSVDKAKDLILPYVDNLVKEIEFTGKKAKETNLKLKTVYIGGGTPTTLEPEQLKRIMTAVKENFDFSNVLEYTVEAGRPDTVTREKLSAIKSGGATRISINPQSMNDEVLKTVGRRHTAKDTLSSYKLARECGFNNINMDLIAGLPSDNFLSFKNSIDTLLGLDPESITVHTLCMKRASNLTQSGIGEELLFGTETAEMTEYAYDVLTNGGYLPYYMYRQAKMVGNLENVGYSKKGFEGLYNVYIMDETHTILACGASSVTKLKSGNEIERIFNFKYPYEYISGFSEQIKRKERIASFF